MGAKHPLSIGQFKCSVHFVRRLRVSTVIPSRQLTQLLVGKMKEERKAVAEEVGKSLF